MKRVTFILIMLSIFSTKKDLTAQHKSIYDFEVASLDGQSINFADFKGKKIMIVNTASKCGLTPQYEGLEKLHEMHKENLVIVGFPANNFMRQEPGSNEEIGAFCEKNYGVQFLMAAKISVKGKNQHPIYTWLTQKRYNGLKDNSVKWNFQKYLFDEEGKLVEIFAPTTKPLDKKITSKL